jgi:eukaryotic-like serine/threonine-protein kinase
VELTQAGSITGSPLYMSPEQAIGDSEPDARSDIYSLGAVAYYLLTGMPPFTSDQPLKVILAHVSKEVVAPTLLRRDIPADLEAIVMRCLAKQPGDRFQDVASLGQALAECSVAGQWNRERAADWWQAELVHPTAEPTAQNVETAAAMG